VDLVYEGHFCGRASYDRIVDQGDTLDLLTLSEIQGMYVRKFGFHLLSGLVYWRSHVNGSQDPPRLRVGARAYFPHIHLNMPFFLPDLGLSDLREFDVPQPILPIDWFRQHEQEAFDWVQVFADNAILVPFDEVGPVPAVVLDRFPDL